MGGPVRKSPKHKEKGNHPEEEISYNSLKILTKKHVNIESMGTRNDKSTDISSKSLVHIQLYLGKSCY